MNVLPYRCSLAIIIVVTKLIDLKHQSGSERKHHKPFLHRSLTTTTKNPNPKRAMNVSLQTKSQHSPQYHQCLQIHNLNQSLHWLESSLLTCALYDSFIHTDLYHTTRNTIEVHTVHKPCAASNAWGWEELKRGRSAELPAGWREYAAHVEIAGFVRRLHYVTPLCW